MERLVSSLLVMLAMIKKIGVDDNDDDNNKPFCSHTNTFCKCFLQKTVFFWFWSAFEGPSLDVGLSHLSPP